MTNYLTSRSNVTGMAGALVAFGGLFAATAADLVAAQPWWIPVVGGAYGIGALLAPQQKADLHVGFGAVEVATLRKELAELRTRVRKYGGRLSPELNQASRRLLELLGLILERGDTLAGNPEALHITASTIRDYLPNSLETYINLPRGFALNRRIEGRRTAHEELQSQLDLLQTELQRIADAVYSGEARSLAEQGRFLEEKFRRSELDLN